MAVPTSHRATLCDFEGFVKIVQWACLTREGNGAEKETRLIAGFGEKYRSEVGKISCKIFQEIEPASGLANP